MSESSQSAPSTAHSLSVSERAGREILDRLGKDGKDPARFGLRIAVVGGGCSGYSYKMEFGEHKDGDLVSAHEEARVFVDPKSILFIGGSTVDYSDALTGAGFIITNPNSSGTCGCGISFSV